MICSLLETIFELASSSQMTHQYCQIVFTFLVLGVLRSNCYFWLELGLGLGSGLGQG